MKTPPELRETIGDMQYELLHESLIVALWPPRGSILEAHNDEGAAIRFRKVLERNPDWYRGLCAEYLSNRKRKRPSKVDTKIRRRTIEKVLQDLLDKGESTSKYAEPLIDIARERVENAGQ